MAHDLKRAYVAEAILLDRDARYAVFQSDIFDEYAWNMLLHLFIARVYEKPMPEEDLIKLVHINLDIGQQWLNILSKDGYIESHVSGDNVVLTETARTSLGNYLDTVSLHQ